MNAIFLSLRVLHVLCAALWFGAAVLLGMFVLPTVERLGTDGHKVLTSLVRGGLNAYMGSVAGLTILSGFYLYWHFTAGFDPTISRSAGAMLYGIGGLLGIIAAFLGGSVIGRGLKSLESAGAALATTNDTAARTAVLSDIAHLRARVKSAGNVMLVLLVVAIILMALGHYV